MTEEPLGAFVEDRFGSARSAASWALVLAVFISLGSWGP